MAKSEEYVMNGGLLVPATPELKRVVKKGRGFLDKAIENPEAMHIALLTASKPDDADQVERPPVQVAPEIIVDERDLVERVAEQVETLPVPPPEDVKPTIGRDDVMFLDEVFQIPDEANEPEHVRLKRERIREERMAFETGMPLPLVKRTRAKIRVGRMPKPATPFRVATRATMLMTGGDVPYKYDEDEIMQEAMDYIASTYGAHYVGEDNVQSLDLIKAIGDGVPFTRSNILKYAARYGKKDGFNRKDILKVIHYAVLLLSFTPVDVDEEDVLDDETDTQTSQGE